MSTLLTCCEFAQYKFQLMFSFLFHSCCLFMLQIVGFHVMQFVNFGVKGETRLAVRCNGYGQALHVDVHCSLSRRHFWHHHPVANTLWRQATHRLDFDTNNTIHRTVFRVESHLLVADICVSNAERCVKCSFFPEVKRGYGETFSESLFWT